MIEIFRIIKRKYVDTAFSGEGAKAFPGRWNYAGVPVVYTAGSLSLAALELLVHLEAIPSIQYVSISALIPKSVKVFTFDELPNEWNNYPHTQATQKLGYNWVESKLSAVLKVPSVIIPSEFNYILNPNHSDFHKIDVKECYPFTFDNRIWKK